MAVWFTMLVCNLLIPVIMLVAGKLMEKNTPKKINWVIGYRTARAMKNQDTWQFAHAVAGSFWWKWGWVSFGAAIVAMLLLLGQPETVVETAGTIIMLLLMIPLLLVIPHTEKALRNHFDEAGNRR